MISDERLEDIANNPGNHWDRDTIGTMAQELLSLRQQVKEWREVARILHLDVEYLLDCIDEPITISNRQLESQKNYKGLVEKYKE